MPLTLFDTENETPSVAAAESDTPLFTSACTDVSRRSMPGRGLLYSFLFHEIVIFWLLTHPAVPQIKERRFHLVEPLFMDSEVLKELPAVGGGESGRGGPEGKLKGKLRAAEPKKGSASSGAQRAAGYLYPGPQRMVSRSPNPDNPIQTILQPDLPKPPTLRVPLIFPNMVLVAALPPPPAPAPVKVVVPPAVKPLPPPEAPKLQGNLRSTEISISQPNVPAPPKPKLIAPPPQPPPVVATLPTSPPHPELAQAVPNPPVPPPPDLPRKTGSASGVGERNLLVLSPIPSPPKLSSAVPKGEAHGEFALGLEQTKAGTSHLGTAAGSASESEKGAGIASLPTGASPAGLTAAVLGLGNGTGAANATGTDAGEGVESGTGQGQRGTGPGAGGKGTSPGLGKGLDGGAAGAGLGKGSGAGAGLGTGAGPFSGISIVGGAGGNVAASNAHPGFGPEASGTYGLTVVATGSSGGGLRDFGVFYDEPVYTVYVDMSQPGDPAPSWTLEYAVLRKPPAPVIDPSQPISVKMTPQTQNRLVAPFAAAKEAPQLPADAIAKYEGQMIVVFALISTEGKLEKMHVMQSPNVELSRLVLDALAKWVFQPALLNGQPAAVKVLLGIPLAPPQ